MENKAIPSLTSIFNAGTGTAAGTITISVAEFSRLKDIETRFEIMRREMLDSAYVPTHYQIILGIKEKIEMKQAAKVFLDKDFHIPVIPKLDKGGEPKEQEKQEVKA